MGLWTEIYIVKRKRK